LKNNKIIRVALNLVFFFFFVSFFAGLLIAKTSPTFNRHASLLQSSKFKIRNKTSYAKQINAFSNKQQKEHNSHQRTTPIG
jgi:hypothetical protein